jgi:predicted methyltransferase
MKDNSTTKSVKRKIKKRLILSLKHRDITVPACAADKWLGVKAMLINNMNYLLTRVGRG